MGLKLNLGCGTKKMEGYVNIDIRKDVGADVVCDIGTHGLPYGNDEATEIIAQDFLEHIPQARVVFVMDEIWRVLKHGGRFESMTPSTDGRGAFQDPTHVSFWNYNSWLYYTEESMRHQIGATAKFVVIGLADIISNNMGHTIHTHAIVEAVKGGAE
jgi:predicted SAM-dependent methyltransferase